MSRAGMSSSKLLADPFQATAVEEFPNQGSGRSLSPGEDTLIFLDVVPIARTRASTPGLGISNLDADDHLGMRSPLSRPAEHGVNNDSRSREKCIKAVADPSIPNDFQKRWVEGTNNTRAGNCRLMTTPSHRSRMSHSVATYGQSTYSRLSRTLNLNTHMVLYSSIRTCTSLSVVLTDQDSSSPQVLCGIFTRPLPKIRSPTFCSMTRKGSRRSGEFHQVVLFRAHRRTRAKLPKQCRKISYRV